jgi:hypothetical protein
MAQQTHTESQSALKSLDTGTGNLSELSTPPSSSAFDFLRNLANRFGAKSALLSAAIGLGVGQEEYIPQAKGEIISLLNTFEQASNQAVPFTYVGGGNLVPFFASATRISNNEVVAIRGSASLVNGQYGKSAAHVVSPLMTSDFRDLKLEIALTGNYQQRNTSNTIGVTNFTISPRYGGAAGAGEDLFTFKLAEFVPNVPQITYWSEVYPNSPLLGAGTSLTLAGFGRAVSIADGWSPQNDGPAYAGETFIGALQNSPGYIATRMDIFSANGANSTFGSSGSDALKFDSTLNLHLHYAMASLGGSDGLGASSRHLYFGAEEVDFIRSTTAVPEPSTLLLTAAGLGSLFLGRRVRSKRYSGLARQKGLEHNNP